MTLLMVQISNTWYRILPLSPQDGRTLRAWRLVRRAGQGQRQYTVHLDRRHGAECTCPDFVFRRQNTADGCKHVQALQEVGLLEFIETVWGLMPIGGED